MPKQVIRSLSACLTLLLVTLAFLPRHASAQTPTPVSTDWTVPSFAFHSGETLSHIRLGVTVLGDPAHPAILVLHGTGGSAASMLTPAFAGELFGPGQPLDASRHYIIIPDALGHGRSTKPSDGLRAKFPVYNYDDMVTAQHRLVTEHLGVKHLKLIIGNSMGGMHAWLWATRFPEMMDAIIPMASQASAMAGRNWILRRMMVETVRNDPTYQNGDYTTQPVSLNYASTFFALATAGGTTAWQKLAPTSADGDKIVAARIAQPSRLDANDFIYQWQSSAGYDASKHLEGIKARVLAINAADDERVPIELGIVPSEIKRIASAVEFVIPVERGTRGHATTGNAKFYKQELAEFMKQLDSLAR